MVVLIMSNKDNTNKSINQTFSLKFFIYPFIHGFIGRLFLIE